MEFEKITFEKTYSASHKVLTLVGVRPITEYYSKTLWENVVKHWYMVFTFFCLLYTAIAEIQYLVAKKGDLTFIDVTAQVPCTCYCTVGLVKLFASGLRRNTLADMTMKLKKLWPENVETNEQKQIINEYMSSCIYVTTAFCIINHVMLASFLFLPIPEMWYRYYVTGTFKRQLPFNIWFPFDYFEGNTYFAVYVFHLIAGNAVVSGNVGFNCWYCIPITHLCMHYKLLQHDIEVVVASEGEINEEKHFEKLLACIEKHKLLIDFKQYLEDVFGDVIFINFFASSLLICLSGFQITAITGYDLSKFSLFLVCALIELYMLCFYGEQFIQNSFDVGHSAYNSLWYLASHKFKMSLLYVIHRCQYPQALTALKFWPVSLPSFSAIMRTSYSYYALLNRVYDK